MTDCLEVRFEEEKIKRNEKPDAYNKEKKERLQKRRRRAELDEFEIRNLPHGNETNGPDGKEKVAGENEGWGGGTLREARQLVEENKGWIE